ncbi:MAG: S9 family peptidase [Myxococcales bacterium]|nr:S9 family peptidase [Myxococcales bacterium]
MSFSVGELVAMKRVTSVAASPDGTWLAVAVQQLDEAGAKYISSIWRVERDGAARPLLDGPCSYTQPCFRSDGALGVRSNRPADGDGTTAPDDDARHQVWVLQGAAPQMITDEPLGVQAFRFARDAHRLVVVAPVLPGIGHEEQRAADEDRKGHGPSALHYTHGPVRHWDHWVGVAAPHFVAYDGAGGGRRDLTPTADREHREGSWDLSRDGQTLVITAARPSELRVDEARLVCIDVDSGEHRTVFERPCEVVSEPKLSPDGTRVAMTRLVWSRDALYQVRRVVLDLSDGSQTELASDWDRWADAVGWSEDGTAVVVCGDDDGVKRLFAIDVATSEVRSLTQPALGSVGQVQPSPDGWVGICHGVQRAPEVFVVGPEGDARVVTEMGSSLYELATLENLSTTGADGSRVQYWLLVPRHATGPCPALIWIHGGPISAWNDQWHWRWNPNVALAAGFAVALPNPRGSTGFGRAFIEGIWGNRYGEACFRDVMAVTDAVAADPRVDGSRLCAMGGSFGGYMANWIGGNTDRFACIVTHASLYDFPRFYGVTDHPPFWSLKMGCDPYRDRQAFNRYSPHTRVTHWTSPTLVIHGEKDYRVPIGEGLALFEALQANGVSSELLVFPDENHWILKPRNITAWYGIVLDFVGRHLGTSST